MRCDANLVSVDVGAVRGNEAATRPQGECDADGSACRNEDTLKVGELHSRHRYGGIGKSHVPGPRKKERGKNKEKKKGQEKCRRGRNGGEEKGQNGGFISSSGEWAGKTKCKEKRKDKKPHKKA